MKSFTTDPIDSKERKIRYQNKKLIILGYIRDSLERRLSAIDATINTLNKQINENRE